MNVKGIYPVLIVATFGLGSCKNNNTAISNERKEVLVNIQKTESLLVTEDINASGNIIGNKTVRLGFLVAGKIEYIAAQEGETIKQGEILANIDPESYEIALEMADANLNQMQDDYNRIKELHDRASISESDFIKITNGLRAAKAQRKLHEKNVEDTKLYSPISGVLLKRGVEEGEIIDKGIPVFGVSDIYTVNVVTSVPEMELQYIKLGNKAKVYIPSLDSTFTGEIKEIGSLAEPTTRTFDVKIELNNPNLLIRPGMTAEVIIHTGKSKKIISLPAGSILHDINNASFIYVVDTTLMQAFKRTISLGKITGNNIEIVSGLDKEELVVISGQQKLTSGAFIKIK